MAPRVQPDVRLLGDADAAAGDPRRRDRLRHRRRPSRLRRQDRGREVVRRRLGPHRRGRPRHLRRRPDRGGRQQHRRHRRRRLLGRVARREGRRRQRPDRRRGRGEGDQVGGRAGRARDQHEPGRLPRPARSRPGRLLAARGAGDRLGARPRRRDRGRRREQHGHAAQPVAVRELSGGAAARARRQRACARRLRPRLLAPGQDLQRHRRSRCRHPLDLPARAHGRDQGVSGAGLLELCPGRLPQGPGHVVRSSAGERRGGSPARGPARTSGPSR